MINNKKFEIIAPVSSISNRTRLFKLYTFLVDQHPVLPIKHVGWERSDGESREKYFSDKKIEKQLLLKGGGYGNKKTKLMYLLWMYKVFIYCLFNNNKSSVVWALGFETAFPAYLASKITRAKIIFDDADRFSMLFKKPFFLKKILEKLEEHTSRNVRFHVVPSLSRYSFQSANFFELKNIPSLSELSKAKQYYESLIWPNADFILNVNGWLGDCRGMKTALHLAEHFNNVNDFHIILVGKLDGEASKLLSERNNVTYLGEVSNFEALSTYFASDFVFTYYDPANEINLYAESNKWGDALATGTGIIVNREVKTAKHLITNPNTISVPYDDTDSLITMISQYIAEKKVNKLTASRKNSTQNNHDYFENSLKKLLLQVL